MAIAAILLSGATIFGAYLELHGTGGIEIALAEMPSNGAPAPQHASTQSLATGFLSN